MRRIFRGFEIFFGHSFFVEEKEGNEDLNEANGDGRNLEAELRDSGLRAFTFCRLRGSDFGFVTQCVTKR